MEKNKVPSASIAELEIPLERDIFLRTLIRELAENLQDIVDLSDQTDRARRLLRVCRLCSKPSEPRFNRVR
jgi:hypothetical protein